jgi:hypothetical protein
VTKQAAVQLVDELDRRGYVERRPHPADRRACVVVFAPCGRVCVVVSAPRGRVCVVVSAPRGRVCVVVFAPCGRVCVERVVALWAEIEGRWADLVGPERPAALRDDLSASVTAAGSPPIRPLG